MKLEIELTEKQAEDLALFLKRVGYSDAQRLSNPHQKEQPYDMLEAISVVQAGLADKGFAPR